MNPGFSKGDCPTSADGHNYGWHFILPDRTNSFVTINCTFEKAGIITKMIQVPTGMHAYVFTPTPDTLRRGWAEITGTSTRFVLSHVCNPTSKCKNWQSSY